MVVHSSQQCFNIAIIGMGPRGLSVLERFLSVAQDLPNQPISIAIFEPNTPGCGVHHLNLPDYLLLNTIASQLGIYPDTAALTDCTRARPRTGPDFVEWCHAKNVRVSDQGAVVPMGGRPVRWDDFLPRRLLGAYLAEAFETIIGQAPKNVSVKLYHERVASLQQGPWNPELPMRGYRIWGDKGSQINVNYLILTTGHAVQSEQPAPAIPENTPIVVQGLGLTAMDQLAALSQGLGGTYHREVAQSCRYIPSGREPKIVVQSREGLIFWARPNTTLERVRHQPIALTLARLAHLRGRDCTFTRHSQLDFDADILPLMRLEMRGAALAVRIAQGDAEIAARNLSYMAEIGADLEVGIADLTAYLSEQETKFGALECDAILSQTIPNGLDEAGYNDWIMAQLEQDLSNARAGLLASPEKAAAEVWRDLREMLRRVVDFHGLSPISHRRFYSHWARIINRLVAGPQKERSEDLLALMHSGIVTLRLPQTPIDHSVLRLAAHVPFAGLCGQRGNMVSTLRDLGLIRAVCASPGLDGIETDPDCYAIGQSGEVTPNLWILGPATEGSTYYNHYIPAPGAPNRLMADAHRVAVACLLGQAVYPLQKTV